MQPTREFWAVVAIAVATALLGALSARPALFVIPALLGAWLVGQQVQFLATLETVTDDLTVTHRTDRSVVTPGETTVITLEASLERPSPATVHFEPGLPLASRCAESDQLALTLDRGDRSVSGSAQLEWPVAGTHSFSPATCTVETELFEQPITRGAGPTVAVDAGTPRQIHVGKGGDRFPPAYGAHDSGRVGSGLEPVELREYLPGDEIDRIDWKATARLGTPHVRKYEAQTDRTVLLIVDRRSSLAMGPPGETKFDYLREVALTVVANASSLEDPVGLIAVDETGVQTHLAPTSRTRRHATIRRLLLEMEPEETGARHRSPIRSGVAVATESATLQPSDAFGRLLGPFVANREYAWRVESNPLVRATRTGISHLSSPLWTLLCTDDSNPREVREAVQAARQQAGHVVVLLAPSALYETGSLGNIQSAYDRYLTFERFRQDLDEMHNVTALQVAPGDRLASVLAARRTREAGTA